MANFMVSGVGGEGVGIGVEEWRRRRIEELHPSSKLRWIGGSSTSFIIANRELRGIERPKRGARGGEWRREPRRNRSSTVTKKKRTYDTATYSVQLLLGGGGIELFFLCSEFY